MSARAEEPPLHAPLDGGQRGSHPARDESSIQFGCPGCIRSDVEAVPVVQADRERVVADLPVEPRRRARREPRSPRPPTTPSSSSPTSAGVSPRRPTHSTASSEGRGTPRRAAPSRRSRRPSTMPGVEEDPDREQVGEDDPDAPRRHAMRRRRCGRRARRRRAGARAGPPRCAARGPALDAEHARTVRRAARRSASPSPPTGA